MTRAIKSGSPNSATVPPWIKKFLERPVRNFDAYKQKAAEFFLEKFQSIGLLFPNSKYQPRFHQLVCIYLAIKEQAFMFLVDLGLGKTMIMLHAIKGLQLRNKAPKPALVLVPSLLLIDEWAKETAIHRPDFKFVSMNSGSTEIRFQQLEESGDVFCLNYAGLVHMVTDLGVNPKTHRRQRQINAKKITELLNRFSIVVLDEITAIKNPQSITFKICKEFVEAIPSRFGLTGTPFGRNLEDLWSQFFVIDGGQSLGYAKYIYDNAFFTITKKFWGGVDKKFQMDKLPLLKRLIYNSAIRYEQRECAYLEEPQNIGVPIPMPQEMAPFYHKIHDQMLNLMKHGARDLKTLETLWMQKREVCSSFLKLTDPATGVSHVVDIPGEGKLERFLQLAEQVPENCKMVVFHNFIHSGERIKGLLDAAKFNAVAIQRQTKNRAELLDKFNNDPTCQFLIVNSHVGALGLNLQAANYLAFFEVPVDPITYTQAIGRIQRTGQTKAMFVYHFYIQGTTEEMIIKNLRQGQNLRTLLLKNPELYKTA